MLQTLYVGNPAWISTQNKLLSLQTDKEQPPYTVPISDLLYLELDHPQIKVSMPAFSALADAKVAVGICDKRHLPVARLMPFEGHSLQGQITAAQLKHNEKLKSKLWQAVVRQKIANQAALLYHIKKDGDTLQAMVSRVRMADSSNREARAAQYYFPEVFKKGFVRDRHLAGTNLWLNYAYILLRNTAARALVSSGLFAGVGIFHHNRHNVFPLADDLMEPLRPLADAVVLGLSQQVDAEEGLTREVKSVILRLLNAEVWMGEQQRESHISLKESAASLAKCFTENNTEHLKLPVLCDLTLIELCGSW